MKEIKKSKYLQKYTNTKKIKIEAFQVVMLLEQDTVTPMEWVALGAMRWIYGKPMHRLLVRSRGRGENFLSISSPSLLISLSHLPFLALTTHPCQSNQQSGCDSGGCGLNPYRAGSHNFYGNLSFFFPFPFPFPFPSVSISAFTVK
jgi:hypothetical protein